MNNNRCMFIEGIGRVHVVGPMNLEPPPPGPMRDSHGRYQSRHEHPYYQYPMVALADAPPILEDPFPQMTLNIGLLAANIIKGCAPGKIRWSVRFQEKAA